MIVNIRIEVTDEQRNAFSRTLHPKAEKRLATREEYVAAVRDFVFVQEMGARLPPAAAPQVTPTVALASVEITQPGPSYAVHCQAEVPESIEKHSTGMDGLPERVSTAAIFHANAAMFALGRLNRNDLPEYVRALQAIALLREELVRIHDEEAA